MGNPFLKLFLLLYVSYDFFSNFVIGTVFQTRHCIGNTVDE
ncbi:MAG: hypothetical protein JWP81_839 [Ferruginibacter sp.]|nr:hypothetical protein [Ferruginibacter sp.]